jgi:RNA polymerase sigma factor FliA
VPELADEKALDPLDYSERMELSHSLAAAIGQLTPREQQVLSLYYVDELNLREIGAVLEVSESRVCQLHTKAILRLRATLQAALRSREGEEDEPSGERQPAEVI